MEYRTGKITTTVTKEVELSAEFDQLGSLDVIDLEPHVCMLIDTIEFSGVKFTNLTKRQYGRNQVKVKFLVFVDINEDNSSKSEAVAKLNTFERMVHVCFIGFLAGLTAHKKAVEL